jgi:hypothetical protein
MEAKKLLQLFDRYGRSVEFKTPSAVLPEIDMLKNAERTLDGSLRVDFIEDKNKIKIVWNILSADIGQKGLCEYREIRKVFPQAKTLTIEYDGETSEYIVDDISATPVFLSGKLHFSNVQITVVEL